MKKRKTKYIGLLLAVVIAISVPLGVYAVKNGIAPTSSSGGYFSAVADRMDFSLDKTEFTFTKTADGVQTFLLTTTLTLKKGEPDIYAFIDSVDIAGMNCNYVLFTPDTENGDESTPEDLVIRTDRELRWNVEISVDIAAKTQISPELTIDFASGLTEDTADEHRMSIPLKITVK